MMMMMCWCHTMIVFPPQEINNVYYSVADRGSSGNFKGNCARNACEFILRFSFVSILLFSRSAKELNQVIGGLKMKTVTTRDPMPSTMTNGLVTMILAS